MLFAAALLVPQEVLGQVSPSVRCDRGVSAGTAGRTPLVHPYTHFVTLSIVSRTGFVNSKVWQNWTGVYIGS